MEDLAIYIHWPFCLSKCPYCDFASVPSFDASLYKEFGELLLLDLKNSSKYLDSRCVGSVFFGGGTPSLMHPESVDKILNFIVKKYSIKCDVEITLEANPATFDRNKMQNFKNAGINRLSLGVQSFSDENLKFLGRIYDGKQAINASEIVSGIFENFSFDFMYGYECQTMENLRDDLDHAINFGCKHVSCYQLVFEENTPFYRKMLSGDIKKIDENEEVNFYNFIEDTLHSRDIFRYEVSNYSMRGFESRHNLSYWEYGDYLGIGPGAHSRIFFDGNKCEIVKASDPFLWRAKFGEAEEVNILNEREKLQEMILMGMRLVGGVAIENLYKKNSPRIVDEVITERKLKFLKEQNLISNSNEFIRLTRNGFIKMNSVISFLLED